MSGLFFAIVPDKKALAGIVAAVQQLNPERSERLVSSKNIHMTLRYIGIVSDELLNTIKNDAGEINLQAFTLTMDKTECWKKPGITVIAPSETPATLSTLVEALERICISAGLAAENKPFRPHVTVLKKSRSQRINKQLNAVTWTVKDFVLLVSDTVKGEIVYTEIGRWGLALNDG